MAVLTRSAILKAVANGDVQITPFDEAKVGPNSVDLHLEPRLKAWAGTRPLNMRTAKEDAGFWYDVHPGSDGTIILQPGKLYLGCTREETYTPKHLPYLDGRSSLGRLGIALHVTAGRGDVGFRGKWTCEIWCVQQVVVHFDDPWCQLTLHTVEGEPFQYSGRYLDQKDATPCRIGD